MVFNGFIKTKVGKDKVIFGIEVYLIEKMLNGIFYAFNLFSFCQTDFIWIQTFKDMAVNFF